MDNIAEITTIAADGEALLLCQFKDGSNVPDILGAILGEVQAVESVIAPGIPARYIDTAIDWSLDRLGELAGYPRPSYGDAATDDDAYRVLVFSQIAANCSHGSIPELYNILRSLGCTDLSITDTYPAAITVNLIGNELTETYNLIRLTLEAATHPIEIDITIHDETPFGFLGDDGGFGFGVGHIGEGE